MENNDISTWKGNNLDVPITSRQISELKMFLAEKIDYSAIFDYDTLLNYWFAAPDWSNLRNTIENQMLVVITPLLPTADYNTLVEYWNKSSDWSNLRNAIENQMLVFLKPLLHTADFNTLINYLDNSSNWSELEKTIENQILVAMKTLLPDVDYIAMLNNLDAHDWSGQEKAIENQMLVVIKTLLQDSDYYALIDYWNNFSDWSELQKTIENQMVVVIRQTKDYNELVYYWHSSPTSELRIAIEDQILECFKNNTIMLTEANIDNFIFMIQSGEKIMNSVAFTNEVKQYSQRVIKKTHE